MKVFSRCFYVQLYQEEVRRRTFGNAPFRDPGFFASRETCVGGREGPEKRGNTPLLSTPSTVNSVDIYIVWITK